MSGMKKKRRYLVTVVVGLIAIAGVTTAVLTHAKVPAVTVAKTKTAAADCASQANFACYQAHYQRLVRNQGISAAFADLEAGYKTDQFVQTNCHQLTHVIGRTAADITPDVAEVYGKGDNFCWSGFYHGVMETVVNKIGPDELPNKINGICASLRNQGYSFYRYNCVHGLGHGFMAVEDDELFTSLKLCDRLTDDWESQSCQGGVFMENIMAANNSYHRTNYLKTDQLMYPCTAVGHQYKEQCYLMQTSWALQNSSYDFNKVFALCGGVDAEFQPTCYQSLGRDASGNSVSDVTKTNATCLLGPNFDAQANCVVGAVKDFISYYHSDKQAMALCSSFADTDLKESCRQTGEQYYKTF